ncbi:MAG TPA: thioredoxin [Bacteroidales bacterium]|nr:thioredoxin [Bacteroidales bacterium]
MAAKSGNVKPLGKREFKQKIYDYTFSKEWEYKGDLPAVIDFYADWCNPCKIIAPILNELSVDYEGRVNFYKVNTEKDPQLSKLFGISSIPTLLLIPLDGKPTMVRGAQPKMVLKRNIEKLLPGSNKGISISRLFSFRRKTRA